MQREIRLNIITKYEFEGAEVEQENMNCRKYH